MIIESGYRYDDIELFRGSCPSCGVFQVHNSHRCVEPGCLVLHYYEETKCKCGQVLVEKSGSGYSY